jgi:hypothetical protein
MVADPVAEPVLVAHFLDPYGIEPVGMPREAQPGLTVPGRAVLVDVHGAVLLATAGEPRYHRTEPTGH